MSIDVESFQVKEGQQVSLSHLPTQVEPVYGSKKQYRHLLKEHVSQLAKLQYRLYAADTHALLVIFQALDAAGKDGAIRHVMSGINPQGCQVFSFQHPSATELDHDFLWRTSQCLPQRGRIGIFNRSYYEEVLIARVHPDILAAERLPPEVLSDHSIWQQRYQSIRDHERHLYHNGTRVLKFMLHISREEQRRRFLDRIDEPDKNWKFSQADVAERAYWDQYMQAYEQCLSETSSHHSPWYVVPADDKKNARLIVSQVILNALEALHPEPPVVSEERHRELLAIRDGLLAEDAASPPETSSATP